MKWLAILFLLLLIEALGHANIVLTARCERLETAIWGKSLHDMPPLPQPIKPKE